MICPKCKKGEIKEEVSFIGFINVNKVITSYCPLCDFKNNVVIKSSIQERAAYNARRL